MTQSFDAAIAAFDPPLPLGVAFSGGADSTALLVASIARWPGRVVALHINHGLQAAASDFEQHARVLCNALNVPLRVCAVPARHAPGQSPEDAARNARYTGLVQLAREPGAQPMASVAVAQHADDQIETLLLALGRGAGIAGLSAMPAQWERDGLLFQRPLLGVAGGALRDWLQKRQIGWVEDPSNASLQFTRNRIRAQILPALEAVFPQFRDTFARSARHAAQAQQLLDESAASDWTAVTADSNTNSVVAPNAMPLRPLQQLSVARQSNLLRFWLKQQYGVMPSTAQLTELLSQVAAARTRGHRIHLRVGHGFVERKGAVLAWYNPTVLHPTN